MLRWDWVVATVGVMLVGALLMFLLMATAYWLGPVQVCSHSISGTECHPVTPEP
jgi:hypothetical protein